MSHIEEPALANVERLVERNRADAAARAQGAPREVRSVGIVGAGLMGTAIAAANVKCGLPVTITDANAEVLAAAEERIAAELALQTGWPHGEIRRRIRACVQRTDDLGRIAARDLILESIVETAVAKQQLYARLAPGLAAGTIVASNTSTIPIGRLGACLADPGRFCGIHFFHPVRRRSLVEIIRGPKTSDATIATAAAYARSIEKMPIVVDDGPGFLVNRLLVPYLNEALEMLLEGAPIEAIERAAGDFGMAMGPLRIMDEIGLDTTLLAGRVLWEAFPERVAPSPLLVTMIKNGRLGRKAGQGFFAYSSETAWDGPGQPDPAVDQILARWARPARPFTQETIAHRLLLPMVLEASRLLEEGKVADPRDIDLAVLFGLGFPAARGGLLYWADTLGAARILDMLRPLASLGPRMTPTALLFDLASRAGRFYPAESPEPERPDASDHAGSRVLQPDT
jgi:3-hydroxyacyl-CoA dehydrogenase/enoyl-CoA hydratase/3-hydroxybutyryl-CoA epimerase/3-hydroxyacyl-CoA dehydrogenase/enoyl-CoA hydratase/3-hydroxybutyryl-CoA epimerase/enoyl-CoA isomerase